MALNLDSFKTHHKALLAQIPISVTIGTKVYSGSKTQVSLDRLYLAEGELEAYQFSVSLSQNDFRYGTMPEAKTTVTIGSTVYRILSIRKDAADVSIILDLGARFANG